MNAAEAARKLEDLLGLRFHPVAIAFRPSPTAGVSRISASAPSGCTYWKLAAEGQVFYTEAADHYNCPVGAHTHGIDLPPGKEAELQGLIGTMLDLGYLREAEIASIPRRKAPFGVAIYSPWALSPCDPDVILLRGSAKQLMLLTEAARAAGVSGTEEIMGRPTCAMIPAALARQGAATSLGCIGNRVYTGLEDGELYAVIAGGKIATVLAELPAIVEANRQLEAFHRERAASRSR